MFLTTNNYHVIYSVSKYYHSIHSNQFDKKNTNQKQIIAT